MIDEKKLANAAMSDEELDSVAGGSIGQTAEDSTLLYAYGLVDDYHRELHTAFHWNSDSSAVDAGWAKAGITCVTSPLSKNRYFKDGKEMTCDEARDYLKANFKQIRDIPKPYF